MQRQHAPATLRNRGPILDVLRSVLPTRGVVLEIASGSGEHVIHFAEALPTLEWQPSDPSHEARLSIRAWTAESGLTNIKPPLDLDVHLTTWPVTHADALICINMIHIAPWSACNALLSGAARILGEGGILYLYGPFRCQGEHTAPSNAAFDRSLREQDPSWGVRDLAEVEAVAKSAGLSLDQQLPMPANNLSLVFHKRPGE